jgi:hypothetical protein
LLEVANTLSENSARAMADASDQGNTADEETIKTSLQRLRQRYELSVATLAQAGSEAQPV